MLVDTRMHETGVRNVVVSVTWRGDHVQVKKVGECVQVDVYWQGGHEGWCGPGCLWRTRQACAREQVYEWPGAEGPYA